MSHPGAPLRPKIRPGTRPRLKLPSVLDPNGLIGELAEKVLPNLPLTPAQAVRDLQLPRELTRLLENPLLQLGFALQNEVDNSYGKNNLSYTVARSEKWELIFLHVLWWILDDANVENVAAMTLVMNAKFKNMTPLFIMSHEMKNPPHLTFNNLIEEWERRRQAPVRYVQWRHLKDLTEMGERQSDQLNALLGLDTIFPPTVGASIAVADSHAGNGSGVNPLPRAKVDNVVKILVDEAQVFPDGTEAFFRFIISGANLPPSWTAILANMGKATPPVDAPRLVAWAIKRGENTQAPGSSTLGSLLTPLLPFLSGGDATFIKGLIKDYNL